MERQQVIHNFDRALWDVNHDLDALCLFITGELVKVGTIDRPRFFVKIAGDVYLLHSAIYCSAGCL